MTNVKATLEMGYRTEMHTKLSPRPLDFSIYARFSTVKTEFQVQCNIGVGGGKQGGEG